MVSKHLSFVQYKSSMVYSLGEYLSIVISDSGTFLTVSAANLLSSPISSVIYLILTALKLSQKLKTRTLRCASDRSSRASNSCIREK